MTRPCKLPLWTASLVLLSNCAANIPPPPPPPPQPLALAQPAVSAADIRKAQQQAYWSGYAAGRRYEKQQNAPDAPTPAPAAPQLATEAPTPAVPVPAAVPVQPIPPPAESYSAKGPARPVATPVN
jgi:hypothetical protein